MLRLNQGLNLTLLARWIKSLIGRLKNKNHNTVTMADLLYGCVGVDGRRKRKQREFRSIGFTIDGYTDEELRARYRFGKESINYITNLLADNLRRKTNRNHPLSALQQVLIALRFYASGSFLQVVGDTVGVNKSTVSRVVANVSLALVARQ